MNTMSTLVESPTRSSPAHEVSSPSTTPLLDVQALLIPRVTPALDAEHYSLPLPPFPPKLQLLGGMNWTVVTRAGPRTCSWGVGRTLCLDPESPSAKRLHRAVISIHGWVAATPLNARQIVFSEGQWTPAFYAADEDGRPPAFFVAAAVTHGFRAPTPFPTTLLATEWLSSGDARLIPPQRVSPSFADLVPLFRSTLPP